MEFVHLEDDDADAELIESALKKQWPGCSIKRVMTKPDFEAAIESGPIDLILSDHEIPGFSGLVALDIAHDLRPETPFIFVSGTIGEERAIEALRHGALDYVLKGAMGRLIPAIQGALHHREQELAKLRAEESLRKSQERFQQIAESIDNFIILIDDQAQCLYANPAYREVLGEALAPGASVLAAVHPDDLRRVGDFLNQAMRIDAPRYIEFRVLRTDGTVRHLEARATRPEYRDNDSPTVLLAGRDVTERKAADELLHEQASLLSKARDGICLLSLERTITYWNESAERLFGKAAPNVLGHDARDTIFATQLSLFDTAFAVTLARGAWQGEFHLQQADGRELIASSSWSLVDDVEGRPKSILCINTDVTAQRQLEREMQRSQRLEGIGMLAGGIAHDLNNLLSPILMSVGLLRPLAATDPGTQMVLDTVEASATHGAELVRQILLFARGEAGQRAQLDLGVMLEQLKGFLRTTMRSKIELSMDHDPELWPTLADMTQLKQVVLNLCVNARDAMPKGGKVAITARNCSIGPGERHGFHGEIPAGLYVCLSVADTGTGIPPEIVEKIFDPFFTTKELGQGTGLGLSTIVGIVQSHGGAIDVESSTAGTTFRIYLPAAPATRAAPAAPVARPELPTGQDEGILVIDDDHGIRFFAERILSAHGYRVFTAADGKSGLEQFANLRDRVQLVICDQSMPGLHGSAVLTQLHREAPDLKLIAISGLRIELPPELRGAVTVLQKPIKPDALMKAVRRVLDTAAVA